MTTFQSNIISIYGEKGKAWLDTLPELVSAISSKLDLRDLQEVTNLTYNYVLSGFRGDNPIILKLGLDNANLKQEAFALKCFAGYGAVKVLAEDEGMLLLERSVPGTSLKSYFPICHSSASLSHSSAPLRHSRVGGNLVLDPRFHGNDNYAIEIVCGVMKKLHQANIPSVHNFPHIKDWLTALDKDWSIPDEHLQTARQLRDQLLQTSEADVLLHGDLHHDNILQNGDDWLVIDPKGVIGSPMNEIWAFVMDIERDISFITQYFNYKTQDLFDWYFVHIILAACWNLEDNIDANLFLRLAEKAYKYVS